MANNNKKQEELKKAPVKVDYPIVLAQGKGKLHISERLVKQINQLHHHAGNVEWSGPVLYSINKGDISNPKSFELEAHAIYPMDIGTSGYTEYDFLPEETFDMHDFYPEILEKNWDMGHMHTHHNLGGGAYFSGTDDQELRDNAPNHAYYLSLIVSMKEKWVARLCVMAKREIKGVSGIKYKNINGKDKTSATEVKQSQEIVYAIDLDVTYEKEVANDFMGEVAKIAARKAERRKKEAPKTQGNNNWSRYFDEDKSPQQSLFDKEIADHNRSFGIGRDGLVAVEEEPEEEFEDIARDFLYRYMSNDIQAQGHLRSLIESHELAYFEFTNEQRKEHINSLDFNAAYHATIPDDPEMIMFRELKDEACNILFNYQGMYQIADDTIDMIESLFIPEDVNMEM